MIFGDPYCLLKTCLGRVQGCHRIPVVSDKINIGLGKSKEGEAKKGEKKNKNDSHDQRVPPAPFAFKMEEAAPPARGYPIKGRAPGRLSVVPVILHPAIPSGSQKMR